MPDTLDRHPRFRLLVDLSDGVLAGPRLAQASAHLDRGCAACRSTLDGLGVLKVDLAEDPLPAPPRSVIRRAERLFVARRLRTAVEVVRGLVGRLIFDQRAELVPAIRSAPGTTRRLLWAVGEYELFVQLDRGPSGWALEGQALSEDGDGSDVVGSLTVFRGDRAVTTLDLDVSGSFALAGLAPGTYFLAGDLDGQAVRVPAFVVD